MLFPGLLKSAHLIKRYKRFLADVLTEDKELLTLHCANTGSMTGCALSGDRIWYSLSNNTKRRYPYSWEITETQTGYFIGVNTHRAVAIVKEAIEQNWIPELSGYDSFSQEVPYGEENSRIDLLLHSSKWPPCYIEIKSVTLYDPITGKGSFPDAVTLRGQKHLRELIRLRQEGARSIIFFLIQHSAIRSFTPATTIDPVYSQWLKQAAREGVETLCYNTYITKESITLRQSIPFNLDE